MNNWEMLLNTVKWKKLTISDKVDDGLPYVTHTGEIRFAGETVVVHQLSNGQRVIPEEEIQKFFRGGLDIR